MSSACALWANPILSTEKSVNKLIGDKVCDIYTHFEYPFLLCSIVNRGFRRDTYVLIFDDVYTEQDLNYSNRLEIPESPKSSTRSR